MGGVDKPRGGRSQLLLALNCNGAVPRRCYQLSTVSNDGPDFAGFAIGETTAHPMVGGVLAQRATVGQRRQDLRDFPPSRYQFEGASRSRARCSARCTKEVVAARAVSGSPVRNAETRARNIFSQSLGLSGAGSFWW